MIDERLAKQAKENMSHSSYEQGTATKEYNSMVANLDKYKDLEGLKPETKDKINKMIDSYARKLADWINRRNSSGAGHVSVMVAGRGNYNMSKHNKWLEREGRFWAEFEELQRIEQRINAVIAGDKIIKSSDDNALELLKGKLAKAQEQHQGYKDHNKKAKKEGGETLPSYVLSNSNGRIKAIKDRIAKLEKMEEAKKSSDIQLDEVEGDGYRIVDNIADDRIQIHFEDKPDADLRNKLKRNGFRWTPSKGVWQCYRSKGIEFVIKLMEEVGQ